MEKSISFKNPLDFLFETARTNPKATALITSNHHYTYETLVDAVLQQAGRLHSNGVDQGKRVAIYSDDDSFVIITIFATWAVGAICIPVNIMQPKEKIVYLGSIIKPDFALGDSAELFEKEINFIKIPLTGESLPIKNVYLPDADDMAIVMFTSGTSGVPKAVPMTYRSIGHNCWETATRLSISSSDRILINSPPYYTSSIIHNLTLYSQGGSVVINRSLLLGDTIVNLLEEYHCTGFGGVPVHFARIAGYLEEKTQVENLRFLMNSGEHLPTPILLKIQKMLPDVLFFCVYGLTEVAGRLCILDPNMVPEKAGSVGIPLQGMNITIRDKKGKILPPGKIGEVHITGLTLMKGYLDNPEVNAKSMRTYGFATGDFGSLDKDGYLYLEGRADDIIKVGGEKVSLKMIEEAIYGFPAFSDYIVTPKFDRLMGYVPCVHYVHNKKIKFKKKELLKKMKAILPSNHIPAFFVELDEIPLSDSGKKLRTALY